MVSAIEFAVRDVAGGSQHGSVAGAGQSNFIQVGSGDSVSLNLSRGSVAGYEQQGQDLLVKLTDGRTIVLSGYFNEAAGDENHLYLSADGQITEVIVSETGDGVLFADYGPVQGWEKWSPLDDLRFANADGVTGVAATGDDPAGMAPLVPGLLGGFGGWGAAAVIGGGAAIIGGGGGGGGGGRKPPTVDPQTPDPLTTNTVTPHITVTGTGEPGEAVSVVVGGITQTTTIATNGTWTVTYPSTGLPPDGSHPTQVTFTQTNGTVTVLPGPVFLIDMTPPPVTVTEGTVSNSHIENLAAYANGVSISGTSEAGATVSVLVNGHTQTVTVGSNGQWTVTFTQAQIPGGEYHTLPAVITAVDPLGNRTVRTEAIAIDTVPHPIVVTSVGGDNLINLSESQSGFAVTGTSTAGAVMTVTISGVTQTVTTGANGIWTANFGAGVATANGSAMVTVSTVDPAGNPSSTTFPFRIDTVATLAVNVVAVDDLVNRAEGQSMIAVTGTSEVGSTEVMVTWNGMTLAATVDPTTGNWTANFPANMFGAMQLTETTITVTSKDSAGNSASANRVVDVDTMAEVAMGSGQIGGDDRLVASETTGFALTGTADAGATVTIVFEGQTRTVTATPSGTWSANFDFGSFGAATRTSTVQVSAVDPAGNTATTTHLINIDTEVTDFRLTAVSDLTSLAVGADAISDAEAANGVDISGTVEPFSTVTVRWGGTTLAPITTGADGIWVAHVPASAIPAGETNVTVTATAVDRYGNTSGTLTQVVEVDRVVEPLARTGGPIGGDGYVNLAEAQQGVTLTGTVEPNSTVRVSLNDGTPFTTNATASGTWTITIPPSSFPVANDSLVTVKVSATDWVGNTRDLATESFRLDTVVPGEAVRVGDAGAGNVLYGIATALSADDYSYHTVDAAGIAAEIIPASEFNGTVTNNGTTVSAHWAMFGSAVPDGTYLVIRNEDAAGNEASTMYLRNTTGEVTVDLSRAGLQSFDFGTIDLSAADATLTLTDAQVLSLTGADKQLTVAGGADDVVNIVGGTFVNQQDGFRLYSLGASGATVLVDEDIRVNLSTGV